MASDPKRLKELLEAAVPDLPLVFRAMFGGILAYVDGKPVASLSDVGLALKLSPADFAELLKVKGTKPLQYEPDAPSSKSYVVLSPAMLKDRSQIHAWVLRSVASAVPARKRRTRAR